jgi:hypothetical protein
MLGGIDTEMCGLDTQRGVVADHRGRTEVGLADGGADDAVVGHRWVEAVFDEKVLANVVDLDLQRGGAVAGGNRFGERAAMRHAEFLEGAQCRPGCSTDIIGTTLEPVEFLHDGQRYHDVGVEELEHAGRIGNQHGGVDDESSSLASLRPVVTR